MQQMFTLRTEMLGNSSKILIGLDINRHLYIIQRILHRIYYLLNICFLTPFTESLMGMSLCHKPSWYKPSNQQDREADQSKNICPLSCQAVGRFLSPIPLSPSHSCYLGILGTMRGLKLINIPE